MIVVGMFETSRDVRSSVALGGSGRCQMLVTRLAPLHRSQGPEQGPLKVKPCYLYIGPGPTNPSFARGQNLPLHAGKLPVRSYRWARSRITMLTRIAA
jgi:hypothetical protein